MSNTALSPSARSRALLRACCVALLLTLAALPQASADAPTSTTTRATATAAATAAELPLWRCAPDLPAPKRDDTDTALREWRGSAALRERVRGGFEGYRTLRDRYIDAGVCDPADFLARGTKVTRFLGHRLRVHVHAAPRLGRVQAALDAQKVRTGALRVGAFNARTIRTPNGAIDQLSKHGLGMAIDIDSHRNPFLAHAEIDALEEVSGVSVLCTLSHDAGERWDSFHKAAAAFRTRYHAWFAAARPRLQQLRRDALAGDDAAKHEVARLEAIVNTLRTSPRLGIVRSRGFLSLPRALVVAMEAEGWIWSTDFDSGADLMHFELRQAP